MLKISSQCFPKMGIEFHICGGHVATLILMLAQTHPVKMSVYLSIYVPNTHFLSHFRCFPKLLFRGISILYHPSSDITMIIISVKGIEEEKRQRGHSGWRPTRGLWKVRRNILTEWIEMEKYLDENLGPLSWVEVAHSLSSFACS